MNRERLRGSETLERAVDAAREIGGSAPLRKARIGVGTLVDEFVALSFVARVASLSPLERARLDDIRNILNRIALPMDVPIPKPFSSRVVTDAEAVSEERRNRELARQGFRMRDIPPV